VTDRDAMDKSTPTLEAMSLTVHLPDELADRLAAEAARRGAGVDETATDLLKTALELTQSERAPRRRLAFAAFGASGQSRGGAEADDLLAEGFGRD
jgi:plasmid stability protein